MRSKSSPRRISSNVCSLDDLRCLSPLTLSTPCQVIPKANSVFTFSVPLYSVLPPNNDASSVHEATEEEEPMNASTVTSPTPPNATVLDLPHIEFELYGNQFCFRSADRASRKFKHKETIEL